MRTHFLPIILLATAALAADTNAFRAYERVDLGSWKPIMRTNTAGKVVPCMGPVLDPAKAATVTNGISLGQLVANLGPGWVSPAARASSIHWDFADGRELIVGAPSRFSGESWQPSSVLSATNAPSECHLWWTTNSMFCFTNVSTAK